MNRRDGASITLTPSNSQQCRRSPVELDNDYKQVTQEFCQSTTVELALSLGNDRTTAEVLLDNCRTTAEVLLDNFRTTAEVLPDNFRTIAEVLPDKWHCHQAMAVKWR